MLLWISFKCGIAVNWRLESCWLLPMEKAVRGKARGKVDGRRRGRSNIEYWRDGAWLIFEASSKGNETPHSWLWIREQRHAIHQLSKEHSLPSFLFIFDLFHFLWLFLVSITKFTTRELKFLYSLQCWMRIHPSIRSGWNILTVSKQIVNNSRSMTIVAILWCIEFILNNRNNWNIE